MLNLENIWTSGVCWLGHRKCPLAFELFRDLWVCIGGEVVFLSLETFPEVTELLGIIKRHFPPIGTVWYMNKISSFID